jgi:hypothetical protein
MTLLGMLEGDDDNTPVTDSAKPALIATALSPHAPPADRKYLPERWTTPLLRSLRTGSSFSARKIS